MNLNNISVVIRVKNAAKDLRNCLSALSRQKLKQGMTIEYIVVDNESTDDSVEVAERYGCKVINIAESEFTWGRALNIGISSSSGNVIIIMSADVEPISDQWLLTVLEKLKIPKIGAVYSRQIPRSNAPIDEVARLEYYFPSIETIVCGSNNCCNQRGGYKYLSNACAVINRDAWEFLKFNELCQGGEEQEWIEILLKHGFRYVYAPNAVVYHSHRESLAKSIYRQWELHCESLNNRGLSINIGTTFYAAASMIKRRLVNLMYAESNIGIKIEGLLILPFEISLFILTGVLYRLLKDKSVLKKHMWR